MAKEKKQPEVQTETEVQVEQPGVDVGSEEHAAVLMMGDLMKVCKRRFTELAVPFNKLDENEQTRLLGNLHDDLKQATRKAVKVIAANARITFRAEVEAVQFKGMTDVKATLKLVNSSETHSLADAAGGYVTVVIEDLDPLLAVPEDDLKGEPNDRTLFDASTDGH
jgi:hypothetical protein